MLRTARTNHFRGIHSGFTLVELMTVIVIVGIILPVISAIMIYTYQGSLAANSRVTANTEMKQGLNSMGNDVRLANQFLSTVPSEFSDPYGPNNLGTSGSEAWSYRGKGSSQRVLITRNLATQINSAGTGRQLVFVDSPLSGFNCTASQIFYEPQLTYLTIYFLRNGTLYRRLLTDGVSIICPNQNPQQRQSCPPELSGSWNAVCKANDEAIASGITGFDVQYFHLNGSNPSTPVEPDYTSNDAHALDTADYIIATLTAADSSGKYTYTMSQRIAKVNQL